jgi:hypothetical protein
MSPMKKKIYLLIVMVVSMLIAQSFQNVSSQIFNELTVNMSLGKSSIVGESDSWKDPVGIQFGADLTIINLNKLMSIRAGLYSSLQGARWEESYSKGKATFLYVNTPVVFRFKSKFGLFGEAGFQPGLLVLAREKGSYNNQPYPSENVMEYYRKFDLAMIIGGGYEFKNNIGVGLRIIPGITNVNPAGDAYDRNLLVVARGTYTLKFKR